ncbi:MAG TPA: energy transducer TonB [Longimicrobium sp.]|nr:energy transducer TonB [Longimicrobium sp.]
MIARFAPPAGCRPVFALPLCLSLISGCARPIVPTATPAECAVLKAALHGAGGDTTVPAIPTDTVPRQIVVRYRLTAEGRAEAFPVVQSTGDPEFDRVLVRAFSCATFTPARTMDGRAVPMELEQPIFWQPPRAAAAPDSSSGVQGRPQP